MCVIKFESRNKTAIVVEARALTAVGGVNFNFVINFDEGIGHFK